MLAFDPPAVEEVEKTLSQKGFECLHVRPKLVLVGCRTRKEQEGLRPGSSSWVGLTLKMNSLSWLEKSIIPYPCAAGQGNGWAQERSEFCPEHAGCQEGSDAGTGEGWEAAGDALREGSLPKGSWNVTTEKWWPWGQGDHRAEQELFQCQQVELRAKETENQ